MVSLSRGIGNGTARTLALALALSVVPATVSRAQFGMGYGGMGYGGYGGQGYGGYGGMGYGGYGGLGYGGYAGIGYGGYGGMGYGYGINNVVSVYNNIGYGYGGLGYGYVPPGYSAGYVNPLFGVGLSPLGVQSALGERALRGNLAPGTASYSRGYQVAPGAYYPNGHGTGR